MTAHVLDMRLPDHRRGGMAKALGAAMILECALLAGAVWWLISAKSPAPATVQAPMHLSLVTLPPPPKPQVVPPKPLPPKPQVQPKPKPEPKPKPQPKPEPQPKPKPRPAPRVKPHPHPVPKPKPVPKPPVKKVVPPKPIPKPVATPPAVKAPPPPPPRPVAAPSASPDAMALFEGQVNAAVQSALYYPPAARMLNRQGRVRVAFDYRDGVASAIRVIQSSGFPLLDKAAIATVGKARYPEPPPALQHRLVHMTVWVQFRETSDD